MDWCIFISKNFFFNFILNNFSVFFKLSIIIFSQENSQINSLLVIGFDPSHSKSAQVSLNLKILSILARTNQHSKKMKLREQNQNLNANQLSKMYFLDKGNDGRLETIQDDDLDDFNGSDFDFDSPTDLQVEIRDDDLNDDHFK